MACGQKEQSEGSGGCHRVDGSSAFSGAMGCTLFSTRRRVRSWASSVRRSLHLPVASQNTQAIHDRPMDRRPSFPIQVTELFPGIIDMKSGQVLVDDFSTRIRDRDALKSSAGKCVRPSKSCVVFSMYRNHPVHVFSRADDLGRNEPELKFIPP